MFCSFFVLQRWLPRQEGRRQAPLVTFVTANSCLLREDDYSFPLLLLSRLNKQKNTYARQGSIRRRSTKKDSTISVLSFVVAPQARGQAASTLDDFRHRELLSATGRRLFFFPFATQSP